MLFVFLLLEFPCGVRKLIMADLHHLRLRYGWMIVEVVRLEACLVASFTILYSSFPSGAWVSG